MRKRNKLVYGVGINDADYYIENCPFYRIWTNMLMRCYSSVYHKNKPTYIGCSVTPEWHYFMTFKAWVLSQDWEGKQLDKDLLVKGNKIYGLDTCVFVSKETNAFLINIDKIVGVSFNKKNNKYIVMCGDGIGKGYIGYYESYEDALEVYKKAKSERAFQLASKQSDVRVKEALMAFHK